jgi:hypothetical protein
MTEIVTVAQQQARRAELVKQREAIDHEIGTIDIRLGLGMSREQISEFERQMAEHRPAPLPQYQYPPAWRNPMAWFFGALVLCAPAGLLWLMMR